MHGYSQFLAAMGPPSRNPSRCASICRSVEQFINQLQQPIPPRIYWLDGDTDRAIAILQTLSRPVRTLELALIQGRQRGATREGPLWAVRQNAADELSPRHDRSCRADASTHPPPARGNVCREKPDEAWKSRLWPILAMSGAPGSGRDGILRRRSPPGGYFQPDLHDLVLASLL